MVVLLPQLTRPEYSPLGIHVEGGSDTPLNNIYISSLKPGTVAFNCGQFQRGDQILTCGDNCLVGITGLEAWDILTKVPSTVEFVLARKKDIPSQLGATADNNMSNARPKARPKSITSHQRRMSFSLHFSPQNSSSCTMEGVHTEAEMDLGSEEEITNEEPQPRKNDISEEKFTVVLNRADDQRLGLGIHGGADYPQLPDIYVCTSEIYNTNNTN